MFTALILMCAADTMRVPEHCEVLVADILFLSKEECEADIYNAIKSGVIASASPNKKPVDYYCVNWRQERA